MWNRYVCCLALLLAGLLGACAAVPFSLVTEAPCVFTVHDTVYSPLSPLADTLGAELARDPSGLFTLTRGEKQFSCATNAVRARANGITIPLPNAPYERLGVVYAPVQPLVDALGGALRWNDAHTAVIITFPETAAITLQAADAPPQDGPDLFLLPLYPGLARRITYDGLPKTELHCSTDGRYLVYLQHGILFVRNTASPFGYQLTAPDAPEITEVQITSSNTWARYFSATMDGNRQAVMIKLDGTGKHVRDNVDNEIESRDGMHSALTHWSTDRKEHLFSVISITMLGPKGKSVGFDGIPCQFSPDSTRLLAIRRYPAPDGQGETRYGLSVKVIDGPQAETMYDFPQEMRSTEPFTGSFSPDSRKIVFTDGHAGIWVMNADCTVPQKLTDGPGLHPAFTPDGEAVVYLDPDARRLYRLPLDGTRIVPLAPDDQDVLGYTFTPDGASVLVSMQPRTAQSPPAPPDVLNDDDVLMAPLATIAALFSVTNTVTAKETAVQLQASGGHRGVFTPGSRKAQIDNTAVTLPKAPVRAHGDLYVPLHTLVTLLGGSATVDDKAQRVTIAAKEHTTPITVTCPIVETDFADAWLGRNRSELYALYPNGTAPVRLTVDTQPADLPTFSPDGTAFCVSCHGAPLLSYTTRYVAEQRLPKTSTFDVNAAELVSGRNPGSSNLTRQVVVSTRDGLITRDPLGGNLQRLISGPGIARPAFSPDGSRIAYLRDNTLYAINPDGAAHTRLTRDLKVHDFTFAPNGLLYFTATPTKPERER